MQTMRGLEGMAGSQAEWSDLLEHSTDLVQSVHSDGRFLYVNGGWLNALGYERQEVADLTVFDIIHPECSSQCAAMMKAVSAGRGIEEVETTLVSKTGQEIRVEGSIDCRFKDGVPAATRCIFRDVSERKAAEEALRESELRLRQTISEQELHARRLASLLESSRAIASARSMEEALEIVTRCAVQLFELTSGIAYEYDPELGLIVARAMWERAPVDGRSWASRCRRPRARSSERFCPWEAYVSSGCRTPDSAPSAGQRWSGRVRRHV